MEVPRLAAMNGAGAVSTRQHYMMEAVALGEWRSEHGLDSFGVWEGSVFRGLVPVCTSNVRRSGAFLDLGDVTA